MHYIHPVYITIDCAICIPMCISMIYAVHKLNMVYMYIDDILWANTYAVCSLYYRLYTWYIYVAYLYTELTVTNDLDKETCFVQCRL